MADMANFRGAESALIVNRIMADALSVMWLVCVLFFDGAWRFYKKFVFIPFGLGSFMSCHPPLGVYDETSQPFGELRRS